MESVEDPEKYFAKFLHKSTKKTVYKNFMNPLLI